MKKEYQHFRLRPDLVESLEKEKKRLDRGKTWIVETALDQYFENIKKLKQ
jgi:predicted transcriptional regulator